VQEIINMNKRYIVILKNENYLPSEYEKLFKLFKEILSGYKLNDIRIANEHIEVDLFSENEDFLKILSNFKILDVRDLSKQLNENIFEVAKDLFNKERYWEFHETLENVWRKSKGKEKQILHGLILLAAAFVHKQRNKNDVAFSVIKRALKELESYEGIYQGFNISYIKVKIYEFISSGIIKEFKMK